MKRSTIFALVLLLIVSLIAVGCGGNAAQKAAQEAGNPGQTKAEVAATNTPVPQATAEFKQDDAKSWSDPVFITGNPKMTEITAESNSLGFTLKDVQTYVYKFFDKEAYDDVVVQADVTNSGDNKNGIALICRASQDGWYEFRVSSGGLYEVFVYQQKLKDRGENPYKTLDSGGSGLIGAKSNKLQFVCQGSSLKIFSNDKEIKPSHGPIEDSTFTSGKIGVGAMSLDRVGVKVFFDKVTISKP